jgi:hypothetical protein
MAEVRSGLTQPIDPDGQFWLTLVGDEGDGDGNDDDVMTYVLVTFEVCDASTVEVYQVLGSEEAMELVDDGLIEDAREMLELLVKSGYSRSSFWDAGFYAIRGGSHPGELG